MKKFTDIATRFCLVLILSFFITSCQEQTTNTIKENTTKTTKETAKQSDKLPLDAHMTKSYRDDLPELLEKKYIRVLTTVNLINFYIFEGHLVGYEYSLLKDYENFLNKQIHKRNLQVVLEFIPVDRDKLLPGLISGYGDISAAGLTITNERNEKAVFTDPYLTGIDEVVITPKDSFQPDSVSDLSGQEVFVRESSSYYRSLQSLNHRLIKDGKKPVRIVKAPETLETENILEMVNSGAIKITVADSHIARIWSGGMDNIEIHEQVKLRSGSNIAWMVRKENPKLLASLNSFLKTHKKGTLLGNIYFNRYFKETERLQNPTDKYQWEKMLKYKNLIMKYASKYGFDWHLILALAFQESGLNQDKISRAGAVGLMQLLPSTATDKNVNIPSIDKVENNIHAGTKYLAFIRDRYFSDESIRPRDRVRFSLAAYNAGPRKVKMMQDKAEKMGLNPTRWFRNVELAALTIVGQETVRYVSNINQYYVLYKSILENM